MTVKELQDILKQLPKSFNIEIAVYDKDDSRQYLATDDLHFVVSNQNENKVYLYGTDRYGNK